MQHEHPSRRRSESGTDHLRTIALILFEAANAEANYSQGDECCGRGENAGEGL